MASPEKIIATEATIGQYLPQKPPMVMVGRLHEVSDQMTVTSLTITDDNLFCEGGFLREPGLIENMAQTAAAGVGYLSKMAGKEPPLGFIGGIRNLEITELPPVGSLIRTEIKLEHEVFDAKMVTGKIFLEDRCIARSELKIFLMKDK